MYIPRLFIILLLLAAVPVVNGASAESRLTRQLLRCAALDNDQQRLDCYDVLARRASSAATQSRHPEHIQPPASFLDSHLVAVPWKEEYKLTVRGFVELVSHAVLDSGVHVSVQGWSREKHDYVLNITMRTPVKLHFLPRESAGVKTPMSLLREVTMDGHGIDAEQFIMIIAAMTSDEKAGEARKDEERTGSSALK